MDDLIERFEWRALWDGPVWLEAASALRAAAEREKDYREALEPFAIFMDWSDKGAPARAGLHKRHFEAARSILSKHKTETEPEEKPAAAL